MRLGNFNEASWSCSLLILSPTPFFSQLSQPLQCFGSFNWRLLTAKSRVWNKACIQIELQFSPAVLSHLTEFQFPISPFYQKRCMVPISLWSSVHPSDSGKLLRLR